ncbi:hypothetical protein PI125_g2852 [Phytophthora idaei]|nr:hypothetical protein PI125_g2852 [Phytophthora idaei]KAG3169798.1 hypothetical protein PI126_g2659 [Phytophthora idaei]
MTSIWHTLIVVAILLVGGDADEAADSQVTFMESVLLIRLINADYDSNRGSSSKRFLR